MQRRCSSIEDSERGATTGCLLDGREIACNQFEVSDRGLPMNNTPVNRGLGSQRAGIAAGVLIVGVLAFAPFAAGRFSRAGISALEVLISVAIILLVVQSRRIPIDRLPLAWVPLAVFAVWSAVPTIFGGHWSTFEQFVDALYWLMMLTAGCCLASMMPWGRLAICGGLAAGGSAAALRAIQEYIWARDPSWRAFGPFFNPGFLSGYLTLTLPVTLALYLRAKESAFSLLAAVCLLLQVSALFLSGTRYGIATGIFSLAIFLAIALTRRGQFRADRRKLLVIGVLVLAVIAISAGPLLIRVGAAETHSGLFRLYTWRATLNMIWDHPLIGIGLGDFEAAFPRYNIAGFTRMAHQNYLQIAAETGLPGLVFFLLALLSALWASAKALRSESNRDEALLHAGILAGALGSAARGMLDSDIYVFAIAISLWAGLGACARPTFRIPRKVCRMIWLLAVALMPLVALTGTADLMSTLGDRAMMRGDPYAALGYYHRAAVLSPRNALYRMRLGQWWAAADPKHPEAAIRQFWAAIKLDPNRAKYRVALGRMYLRIGDYSAAVPVFQDALKLNPKEPKLILSLAQTYEALGRQDRAMNLYRKLLRQEKTPYETVKGIPQIVETAYAIAHFAVAKKAEENGRTEEAIGHYATDRVGAPRRVCRHNRDAHP